MRGELEQEHISWSGVTFSPCPQPLQSPYQYATTSLVLSSAPSCVPVLVAYILSAFDDYKQCDVIGNQNPRA